MTGFERKSRKILWIICILFKFWNKLYSISQRSYYCDGTRMENDPFCLFFAWRSNIWIFLCRIFSLKAEQPTSRGEKRLGIVVWDIVQPTLSENPAQQPTWITDPIIPQKRLNGRRWRPMWWPETQNCNPLPFLLLENRTRFEFVKVHISIAHYIYRSEFCFRRLDFLFLVWY